jgi:hypothetical protein
MSPPALTSLGDPVTYGVTPAHMGQDLYDLYFSSCNGSYTIRSVLNLNLASESPQEQLIGDQTLLAVFWSHGILSLKSPNGAWSVCDIPEFGI